MEPDVLMVGDCRFVHSSNERFELYSHTDKRGWRWEVWRHLKGPICTKTWFASVDRRDAVRMLNTATADWDGRILSSDPLYHINCYSHQALLEAIIPLIEAGQWPTSKEVGDG